MINTERLDFADIDDPRRAGSCHFSLTYTLVSALAMFSLRYLSLLQFDQHARGPEKVTANNLKTLFGVDNASSESTMREFFDPPPPEALRPAFRAKQTGLQRAVRSTRSVCSVDPFW